MHLNIILRVYELRKSNINLHKYNINFNRVHLSGKDEETYVTVCFKRFRCSSVGFNENLNYIYQQMSEVRYLIFFFSNKGIRLQFLVGCSWCCRSYLHPIFLSLWVLSWQNGFYIHQGNFKIYNLFSQLLQRMV